MLEPGQVIDRYTVDTLLGQGGMAVVYRVTHNQLGSFHALKVLTISSAGITERLLQEGRVQASLRHPNIVAVTDVIDVAGQPGLVMEYIDGPALDEWLRDHHPDAEEAERIFRAIVSGVASAHEKGTIHRDLKPANVMLAPASGTYVPKVADFGLAKAVAGDAGGLQQTRSGVAMGTPAYMAPEQIRDAKGVDERADVFSLGCILYELVCGRAPFVGPDILSIFNAVASGEYPAAVSLIPNLPIHLNAAIQGSIVVDRERRIGSCRELLEVLDGASLRHPDAGGAQRLTVDHRVDGAPSRSQGGETWTADMLKEDPRLAAAGLGLTEGEADGLAISGAPAQSDPDLSASILPRTGSLEPGAAPRGSRKRWLLVPLLLIPVVLAVGGVVAMVGGGLFFKNRWEARTRDALTRHTGGEVSYARAVMRPQGVVLHDLQVLGSDGEVMAAAPVVELTGTWSMKGLSAHFSPSAARVEGLRVDVRRGESGWVLPTETLSALRGTGEAEPPAFTVSGLVTDAVEVAIHDDAGTLTVGWDGLSLTDLVVDPADPRLLTSARGTMTAMSVDVGEPVIGAASLEWFADGALAATDLQIVLRLTEEGALDAPPVLDRVIPDWLGGLSTERKAPWWGLQPERWPLKPSSFEANSGMLLLLDRAHGLRTVRLELALDRAALGPAGDGLVAIDVAGHLADARLSLAGEAGPTGEISAELRARQLPLTELGPFFARSLRHYAVEPATGSAEIAVQVSVEGDTLDAELAAVLSEVSFAAAQLAPGASPPPRGTRKLFKVQPEIEVEHRVSGRLSRPRFTPVTELLFTLEEAVMKPAGGAIRPPGLVAGTPAPRRTAPSGTAPADDTVLERPEPEPETDETPTDEFPEATERDRPLDKFGREMRDTLEELRDKHKAGRPR